MLGRPENLEPWAEDLLAYSASIAPAPKHKKDKASVSPTDLAERVAPLTALRAQSLLRSSFGDVEAAREVLERLTEILAALDETAAGGTVDEPARGGTTAGRPLKAAGGRRAPKP